MKILALFLLLLSFAASEWKATSYQPLKSKNISLNFVRVINERFPKMSERQIDLYLKEAARIALDSFDINITFKRRKELSINHLFQSFTESMKKELQMFIYDFKNNKGDKNALIDNLHSALLSYQTNLTLKAMIDYAQPYLLYALKDQSTLGLATALIDTEIHRLEMWLKIKAKDGQAIIDDKPFNEWVYWDSLGYGDMDFDIILTNQLIASAEYYGQDIHSALRGGIVAGTTSYRKNSPYNAFIFTTSFLFLNNDPFIKSLRGGKNYTADEAARYAGAYLAHELGHMLLRLNHPFGRDACVMSPAKMLYFDQWYKNLDAQKCLLESDGSMTPGSVTLFYNDTW